MLHSHGMLHPWIHLVLFGMIAWMGARAVRFGAPQVLVLFAVVALGLGTEWVEYWYHSAPLEDLDVVLDAVGAVIGAAVAMVQARRAQDRAVGRWD